MTEVPVPGLIFPEGPRWRDGWWWLSDQNTDRVFSIDEQGVVEVVCEVEAPSGLGFLPDASLLVVSMRDPSLVRFDGSTVKEHADLRPFARHVNDMFVAGDGRAYVGAFDDPYDPATNRLLLVDPDGAAVVAAEHLACPNGITATIDGHTLLVAETFGGQISAFDIGGDGTLGDRSVWARLPDGGKPDGLCLDAAGDVWVASFENGEFLHLRAGGEVLERITFTGRWAMAPCLGGRDGRSLLFCTSETSFADRAAGRGVGHIDIQRVDVPGVQLP